MIWYRLRTKMHHYSETENNAIDQTYRHCINTKAIAEQGFRHLSSLFLTQRKMILFGDSEQKRERHLGACF